ncbi:MAG: NUDIX domain-containing protein [Pseudonocardiaceae bacterium]|nr:NUDIX domain-containing protein [Pseudonocardiaceae bacterium]
MADAEELVAHYDEWGNDIGSVGRGRVRREGLWHASGSVLVRSADGERIYVHLRSPSKDIFPSMHDCWAGGVVAAGESPEVCARRELAEELGIRDTPLRRLFTERYCEPPVRVHAFCYETRWDGPIEHQEAEITAGEWLAVDQLRARLARPDWPFVPDGRALFEKWLRSRR